MGVEERKRITGGFTVRSNFHQNDRRLTNKGHALPRGVTESPCLVVEPRAASIPSDQLTQPPVVVRFHLNKFHPTFLALRPSNDSERYVEAIDVPWYSDHHPKILTRGELDLTTNSASRQRQVQDDTLTLRTNPLS